MKYMYYALFNFDQESKVEVTFPDFTPNASTFGNNIADALSMAKDVLMEYLLTAEDYGDKLPAPTVDPQTIPHDNTQLLIPIQVDTTIAREREEN